MGGTTLTRVLEKRFTQPQSMPLDGRRVFAGRDAERIADER